MYPILQSRIPHSYCGYHHTTLWLSHFLLDMWSCIIFPISKMKQPIESEHCVAIVTWRCLCFVLVAMTIPDNTTSTTTTTWNQWHKYLANRNHGLSPPPPLSYLSPFGDNFRDFLDVWFNELKSTLIVGGRGKLFWNKFDVNSNKNVFMDFILIHFIMKIDSAKDILIFSLNVEGRQGNVQPKLKIRPRKLNFENLYSVIGLSGERYGHVGWMHRENQV